MSAPQGSTESMARRTAAAAGTSADAAAAPAAMSMASGGDFLDNLRRRCNDILDFASVTASATAVRNSPWLLLVLCCLVDLIGFASYLLLIVGEVTDIFWAPIAFLFLYFLSGSMPMGSFGFLEEVLPFTDIVPTATITWALMHVEALDGVRQIVGVEKGAKMEKLW